MVLPAVPVVAASFFIPTIIPPPPPQQRVAEQVADREGGGCTEHNIRFTCLSRRQQWWTSGLMDPERPPEHTNDALRPADVQYGARVPTQTQTQTPPGK